MRIFGFGKKKSPAPEVVKKERKKLSAIERLERQRELAGAWWNKKYDAQSAMRRVFPRQGVGQNGVRVFNKNFVSPVMDDGTVFDADESKAKSLRAQERYERDAFYNPLSMYGMDEKVLQYYESRVWIGYPAMAHLMTHELISGVVDIPAQDAIARGYKIEITEDEDEDKDGDGNIAPEEAEARSRENAKKVRKLKRIADKQMHIPEVLRTFGNHQRGFGVAYVIPVFKDGDAHDYSKPFNIDGVKKGSLVGFKTVEPIWMSYEFNGEGANSPTSLNFYEPEWYRIANGNRIHKSWIVKKVYMPVSDLLKPTYYYGGVSLPQMVYERMYCADKTANECPMLAMTKRLLIADANVQAMTNDKSVAELTMQALNYFRDNFSVFFKNPNTQVSQIDTSLEGVPQISMMSYQLVAAIARMPVTKLLKNVPTGLQSTGDYEMDDYHELLGEIQKDYKDVLEFFFKILTKSEFGKVIDVTVTFNPLEVPKEDKNIQNESGISSIMTSYLQSGVVTVQEVRDILRKREGGMFAGLSAKLPEQLQKKIDAEMQQGQPQMGGEMTPPDGSQIPEGGEEENAEETDATLEALLKSQEVVNGGETGVEADGGGEE